MSSAASDRHVVDNVSDPVSSETCEEGEPEPSNRDIMRLLMAMNKELNKKLDCLSETVERLQGEVFDLKQENTRLSAELDRCRKKEEDMQTQIKEAMFSLQLNVQTGTNNIPGETTSSFSTSQKQQVPSNRQKKVRERRCRSSTID